MNGIGVLKRAENPSKTKNALDDLRLNGMQKMLRWFLNVFQKIVAEHLQKLPRLHTSRRRRLRETIHRKRPHFWQSEDWYLLYETHQHIDPNCLKSPFPKPALTCYHIPPVHQA
ncbi:hypothetical protein TNCV_4746361 [Trichonephila clavipes]|nr:hypothetical protein TNCV_4746361 [Trichonephila clavipes]